MLRGFAGIAWELAKLGIAGTALWFMCLRMGAATGYAAFLAVWALLNWRPFSMPSPSGRGELRGWFISLAFPLYLACIPLYFGAFRALMAEATWLEDPWNAIAFLPLWSVFGYTFFAMCLLPFFSLRFVARIQEGRPTRRFLFFGGWDGSRQEHLWLEAGDFCDQECLLITSHDEHHCECFVWLPDSEASAQGRRVKFPDINLVFGRYPRLRRVLLSHDWEWLERLWEKHGYDPKAAPPPFYPSPNPKAGSREEEVADYFNQTLPSAMGFPNLDHRSLEWKEKTEYRVYAWSRIVDSIPLESRLYRVWSDEAAASLRELKPKRSRRSESAAVGNSA